MTFQRISGIRSISQTIRAKILSRRRNAALKQQLIINKDDSIELDEVIEDLEALEAHIKRLNITT